MKSKLMQRKEKEFNAKDDRELLLVKIENRFDEYIEHHSKGDPKKVNTPLIMALTGLKSDILAIIEINLNKNFKSKKKG